MQVPFAQTMIISTFTTTKSKLKTIHFLQACLLLGKALKQRETSIFCGLVTLTTFCMGYACINVQQGFWNEPIIVWIACVISTGNLYFVHCPNVHDCKLISVMKLL